MGTPRPKPSRFSSLNWANPLSRGLVDAVPLLTAGDTIKNWATGRTQAADPSLWSRGAQGLQYRGVLVSELPTGTVNGTVLMIGAGQLSIKSQDASAAPGPYGGIYRISIPGDGYGTNPGKFSTTPFAVDQTSRGITFDDYRWHIEEHTPISGLEYGGGWADELQVTVSVVAFDGSKRGWINGQSLIPSWPVAQSIPTFGNWVVTYQGLGGFFTWNRVLSALEMQKVSANPWQLFQKSRISLVVPRQPAVRILATLEAPTVVAEGSPVVSSSGNVEPRLIALDGVAIPVSVSITRERGLALLGFVPVSPILAAPILIADDWDVQTDTGEVDVTLPVPELDAVGAPATRRICFAPLVESGIRSAVLVSGVEAVTPGLLTAAMVEKPKSYLIFILDSGIRVAPTPFDFLTATGVLPLTTAVSNAAFTIAEVSSPWLIST